jgi:hypothetical protein
VQKISDFYGFCKEVRAGEFKSHILGQLKAISKDAIRYEFGMSSDLSPRKGMASGINR